jgi:hypothetical protein
LDTVDLIAVLAPEGVNQQTCVVGVLIANLVLLKAGVAATAAGAVGWLARGR